ncbi:MAG: hypothetical protein GXP47_11310 [Acidobacteria bacterium]|nr:hypothetical protein [Acidobacteriota bacterium]
MRRKTFWPGAILTLGVAAAAWASGPVRPVQQRQAGPARRAQAAPDTANLLALHDPKSSDYNGDCLTCHSSILKETSKDPRIPSFHQAMMPFTPGYNPAHGPNNGVCVQCHRFVDLRMDSAGALRKQVNPELCALCHGPSGPGPKLYDR